MDVDALIRSIAEEVMKQLQQQQVQKPCVMVLANRELSLVSKVESCLEEAADLYFLGEDMGDRTPCRYILPSLCPGGMADLARGSASTKTLAEVLRVLLLGKEVEVLEFEYRKYGETAPGPLLSMYESYEKTLAGFGLREFSFKRPDTTRVRESLVTEKIVEQAADSGASTLAVPTDALITPLAAEAAKNLSVNILKQL